MGGIPPFGGGVDLGGRVWYNVKVLHITHNLFAGADTLSLPVYEPIAKRVLWEGAHPIWGRGFVLGGRVWYPVIVLHIRYNWFAGNEMLSLSVYEPIAMPILLGGVPQFLVGVDLGGHVWYTVKVLCIRYNLFAGTETLSLSVYEPRAIQILLGGPSPNFGRRGGVRESSVVHHESPSQWA